MRTIPPSNRPFALLVHPIPLFAAVVLLINARVLQPYYPSWITGKLGDLAWLVLTPLLLGSILAFFWFGRPSIPHATIGWLSLALVGVFFSSIKLVPAANSAVANLFGLLTGLPAKLALDASDLIVLPGLAIAAYVWTLYWNPSRPLTRLNRPVFSALRLPAGALIILALLADAPAPLDLGITCVTASGNTLVAFHDQSMNSYGSRTNIERRAYTSLDGGETWQYYGWVREKDPTPTLDPAFDASFDVRALAAGCIAQDAVWRMTDPANSQVRYLFSAGEGFYRSEDGGESLIREFSLENGQSAYNGVILPDGRVVLAGGLSGIYLRHPLSGWSIIDPDTF